MVKFKRVNIVNLSKRYNCEYLLLDILRQTAVERIVDFVSSKSDIHKDAFIDAMLSNARLVLTKMVIEKEVKK